jgi:nicotinate phosphoribosyltransferase
MNGTVLHDKDERLPGGIGSLLDTDLYKLTMQAALLQHYPQTGLSFHF